MVERTPDPESRVCEIRRKTRRRYSSEEKIRIVLEGLKGEESIAEICRREGISPNLYYNWSKEFLEAGKRRLMGSHSHASRFYPRSLPPHSRSALDDTTPSITMSRLPPGSSAFG